MASIRRRGNKFHVQVRRKGQASVTKSFINKREAETWARQMEVLADRNELPLVVPKPPDMFLGDLVRRYIDEVVCRKRCAEYETIILQAFLRHPICQKPLKEVDVRHFCAYRDERLESLSTASLQRQLNPLRNMYEVAMNEWCLPIPENPLDKVKLKAVDNRRERRLKDGELERLIAAARTRRNPYIIPIIIFAISTSMRRGEILSLRWTQVDWKRRSVTLKTSKNGYSRTVPLTSQAYEILLSLERNQEAVFPTTANAVRLLWQRICTVVADRCRTAL
jgi:integrase